jgi:hypothetical protein
LSCSLHFSDELLPAAMRRKYVIRCAAQNAENTSNMQCPMISDAASDS